MPKTVIELFAIDILVSLEKVKRYSRDYTSPEKLLAEEIVFSAILRELKMIGEGAKRILAHPPYAQYTKPSWRIMIGCSNSIAHHHFGINPDEIFKVIQQDIPLFEHDLIEFIIKIQNEDLLRILAKVKDELALLKRHESIDYLENIEQLLG